MTSVLFFLPVRAEHVREWVVWASAIAGGLVTLSFALWHRKSPVRRILTWLWRRNISAPVWSTMGRVVRAANKPEADLLHSKIEELARTNDAQHGEVTRAVLGLRQDFVAHMDSANDARSLIEAQIAEVRVLILHRTDPTGEMPITVKETP